MSTQTRTTLTTWSVGLAVALSVFSIVQAGATIPYRLDLAESHIKVLEADIRAQREMLTRIEERVKWLQDRWQRGLGGDERGSKGLAAE